MMLAAVSSSLQRCGRTTTVLPQSVILRRMITTTSSSNNEHTWMGVTSATTTRGENNNDSSWEAPCWDEKKKQARDASSSRTTYRPAVHSVREANNRQREAELAAWSQGGLRHQGFAATTKFRPSSMEDIHNSRVFERLCPQVPDVRTTTTPIQVASSSKFSPPRHFDKNAAAAVTSQLHKKKTM